jgi:hypothetical protein
MRTRTTVNGANQRAALVLVAVAALVLIEAWPIPTIVGGFVLCGIWLLGAAEERRMSAYRHHRPSPRGRRAEDAVALVAAVGAALAAQSWPQPLAAGSLIFLAVAIGLLTVALRERGAAPAYRPSGGRVPRDGGRAAGRSAATSRVVR